MMGKIIAKIKEKKQEKKLERLKGMSERERVEERREEVLAQGRKFKYPLQYAKYRIVTISIFVFIFAMGAMYALLHLSLYKWQRTDAILYKITQVLPFSVAKIEGKKVRYSDYLMIYKSTITPVLQQQGKSDTQASLGTMEAHYKRAALTEAENYTYALKIAEENGIKVSEQEISQAIEKHRKIGGTMRSQETFVKILADNFGLTLDEYRRMMYLSLIEEKVAAKIDDTARARSEMVASKIAEGVDLAEISRQLGEDVIYEETGGMVDKMNVDGGRSVVALTLNPGQVSEKFISNSGDGYYFVKLIEKSDSAVNYASIKILFKELEARASEVRNSGRIVEKIRLAEK